MRALKAALCLWLLAASAASAITIQLSETTPFFQLPYVAVPGVVIVCNGTSFTIAPFEFCDDGLGNAEQPVASIEFFPPNLVTMTTNGNFCSVGGGPDFFPSQCLPFFNGDVAVEFESPALPGQPSETDYTPAMNEPGFGFFMGQAVDYVFLTRVPLREPPVYALIAAALLMMFAGRGATSLTLMKGALRLRR
jgi:hypothetical protein